MLGRKYKVLGVMGRGSNGVTYRVSLSAQQRAKGKLSYQLQAVPGMHTRHPAKQRHAYTSKRLKPSNASTAHPMQAQGPDGTVVAVKALSLRRMTDWKQLELFEREANTLKFLDHPGIPKYIDYFSEDMEKDRGFFLVQASPSEAA